MPTTLRLLLLLMLGLFGLQPVGYAYDGPVTYVSEAGYAVTTDASSQTPNVAESPAQAPSDTSRLRAASDTSESIGQISNLVAAESGGSTALSTYRLTTEGETFMRYESANPAFSRVTPTGGVTPGTFAAPASDGLIPVGERVPTYNLPSPNIPRPNAIPLNPPAGTPVIGPRPVSGGTGNEVIFPFGF